MNAFLVVDGAGFRARAMQTTSQNDVCEHFDAHKKSLFYRYIS